MKQKKKKKYEEMVSKSFHTVDVIESTNEKFGIHFDQSVMLLWCNKAKKKKIKNEMFC